MGSARAHPYSSHTTKRSFPSHTLLLLLLCCSGAPQTFPREQKPPPVWVCLFYQWHWEWVWECDKCWGQQQLGGRVCSSGLVWDSTATPFLCWWVAWAAKAGLCNFPFPCVEQELPPMALMFTSWISQPKPLEWENCCIFLPFTKRKKKPKPKHLCGHWRLFWAKQNGSGSLIPAEGSELVLSKAVLQKWCIRRALPYSLLDTCPILSSVFAQGMHVAHSLSFAAVPEGSWACVSSLHHGQAAFSLVAVTVALHEADMALCTWGGCLHLTARGEGHPAPCSDLFCPAFRLFQRIWRQVWCPERSDGQGKLFQTAMTSVQAEQPG